MAYCYKCGDDYSDKRASLGYRTCLHCGDKEASIEAHRRTKCVAPAYSKGAYQYVGDVKEVMWLGRKV
jgi:hypothetical protein